MGTISDAKVRFPRPITKLLLQVFFAAGAIFLSGLASAATYTVTKTADTADGTCDADCSLREAIVAANANAGHDFIHFAIPAAGVQTIQPDPTELDPITDPVTIDGYTQCFSPNSCAAVATASSPATILIEISGEKTSGNGLSLDNGSSGSTIRGLSINRFTRLPPPAGLGRGHAINIGHPPGFSDSHSNWIAGNYLNVRPDGHTIFPGEPYGAGINEAGNGNNIIGHDPLGPNYSNPAADRNVISGAGSTPSTGGFAGIQIFLNLATLEDFRGNTIRGNYIGTDHSGTQAAGNRGFGIRSEKGDSLMEGNLISANGVHGIALIPSASNNMFRDNKIGTDVTGMLDLGNSGAGIAVGNSTNNTVEANTVAFNKGSAGIIVIGNGATKNKILSNAIFSNAGLGIDLAPSPVSLGPLLNDPLDGDTGPNSGQNFPVIDGKRSFINPALVQVWGSLDSKPSQGYRVQVFSSSLADPSGYGEGEVLIGEMTVATDASGHVDFHFPATLNAPAGTLITATATDLLTNDTSEFSAWVNVDEKGSPTAYEQAAGAAGGDGGSGEAPDGPDLL